MKIDKTEAIACTIMLLSVGALTGNMLSDHNYVSLRQTMIQEMEGFTSDMEWDIKQGELDSSQASYYLHNFEVIREQLTYTPDEYTEWYEQNSKYNTKYNSNWLDSVCNCSNNYNNYKLNTITNG